MANWFRDPEGDLWNLDHFYRITVQDVPDDMTDRGDGSWMMLGEMACPVSDKGQCTYQGCDGMHLISLAFGTEVHMWDLADKLVTLATS